MIQILQNWSRCSTSSHSSPFSVEYFRNFAKISMWNRQKKVTTIDLMNLMWKRIKVCALVLFGDCLKLLFWQSFSHIRKRSIFADWKTENIMAECENWGNAIAPIGKLQQSFWKKARYEFEQHHCHNSTAPFHPILVTLSGADGHKKHRSPQFLFWHSSSTSLPIPAVITNCYNQTPKDRVLSQRVRRKLLRKYWDW